MPLDFTQSYVQGLIETGADAHQNLYYAQFFFNSSSSGMSTSELNEALSVRLQGFTTPQKSQKSYTVKYITQYIERPAAKVEVSRNLTLTFRVDANYIIYKELLKQQGITFNPAKGFVTTDITKLKGNDSLFDIGLYVVDEALSTTEVKFKKFAEYKNCWITSIDPLSFRSTDSTPITVRITIQFLDCIDWQSETIETSGDLSSQGYSNSKTSGSEGYSEKSLKKLTDGSDIVQGKMDSEYIAKVLHQEVKVN